MNTIALLFKTMESDPQTAFMPISGNSNLNTTSPITIITHINPQEIGTIRTFTGRIVKIIRITSTKTTFNINLHQLSELGSKTTHYKTSRWQTWRLIKQEKKTEFQCSSSQSKSLQVTTHTAWAYLQTNKSMVYEIRNITIWTNKKPSLPFQHVQMGENVIDADKTKTQSTYSLNVIYTYTL